LLGLVASLVLRCDDCVKYHLVESRAAGSSRKEIVEAMSIASWSAAPSSSRTCAARSSSSTTSSRARSPSAGTITRGRQTMRWRRDWPGDSSGSSAPSFEPITVECHVPDQARADQVGFIASSTSWTTWPVATLQVPGVLQVAGDARLQRPLTALGRPADRRARARPLQGGRHVPVRRVHEQAVGRTAPNGLRTRPLAGYSMVHDTRRHAPTRAAAIRTSSSGWVMRCLQLQRASRPAPFRGQENLGQHAAHRAAAELLDGRHGHLHHPVRRRPPSAARCGARGCRAPAATPPARARRPRHAARARAGERCQLRVVDDEHPATPGASRAAVPRAAARAPPRRRPAHNRWRSRAPRWCGRPACRRRRRHRTRRVE